MNIIIYPPNQYLFEIVLFYGFYSLISVIRVMFNSIWVFSVHNIIFPAILYLNTSDIYHSILRNVLLIFCFILSMTLSFNCCITLMNSFYFFLYNNICWITTMIRPLEDTRYHYTVQLDPITFHTSILERLITR